MHPAYALNTYLGPALVIVLVFAQCAGKYSSDTRQKFFFCGLLAAAFIFMVIDLIFSVLPNPAKIIWYCIAALFLYIYFSAVQKETKIDSLTGLGNRYSFNEFTNALSHHKTGESWIIAMIDMDDIKSINNAYGHLEGDNALRELAAVIKSCLRKSDFAARYGGDEFVLAAKAETGIEELMNNIKKTLVKHNEKNRKPYKIEISYAFDIYTTGGSRSIEEFLNHIDELMYKHKKQRLRTGDGKPGETA